MDPRFVAKPVSEQEIAELGAASPANPFATASYFESKRQLGYVPWVIGLTAQVGGLEIGCGAFFRAGRLNRILEIASLPPVSAESPFWGGLREFCLQHGVTKLVLDTFGSPPGGDIPVFGTHCTRRDRCEFALDLAGNLAAKLGSNHKRNLKRAQKAGLVIRRTCSAEDASAHRALQEQSMDRRRLRGEDVGPAGPSLDDMAFLRSGAGELYQAVRGETVLSSVLVLRAPKGAYYHSAGTSPEGMTVGASHLLIHSVANQLSADGVQVFNLGGADTASSLARFKEGFGASRVHLVASHCDLGPSWRRWANRGVAFLRSLPEMLQRPFSGQVSRMIVYATATGMVRSPALPVGLTFRALTPEDLQGISVGDPSFRARQLERLSRFGTSHAYAVIADGHIAHVSWLLPPTAIEKDVPRVLKARAGEAEITCCETLPAFRGRGIYGLAIGNILDEARRQGIRRVLMKTAAENKASQSGIEKAGLERVGSIFLVTLPLVQRLIVWRRFR